MKYILSILFVILFASNNFGQCSDSGICTLDGHTQIQDETKTSYSFGAGYSFSLSGKPDNISYSLINLSGGFTFDNSLSGFISVPYLFQSVKDANSNSGPGDAIISISKKIDSGSGQFIILQLGTKLPLSLVQKENFTYLNGYGTFDLIPGITFNFGKFSAGAAAQIPLTKYTDDRLEFSRGFDLLIHLDYYFTISDWNMRIQNFNIKRVNKSELTLKEPGQLTHLEIPESDFLQINLLFGGEKKISKNILLDLSAAFPLLKRKENSDGTQRALTLSAGVKYIF